MFLFGLFHTLEKTAFLFSFGYMQEELNDDDPVTIEVALETADVLKTLLPDVLGNS